MTKTEILNRACDRALLSLREGRVALEQPSFVRPYLRDLESRGEIEWSSIGWILTVKGHASLLVLRGRAT